MDRIEVVGGELVIVMELADRSLHDAFEECLSAGLVGVPRDTLLRYIRDAAEGLDHMNEKHNLQHLDIKPRNLFLVSDRVKVGDFGLVKHLERSGASGILGGVTPLYAAAGNLHRRHQRAQRSVQPRHRLSGTAHRPAAVQRQERPPAGPAAHQRGAGAARLARSGTAGRRPRPVQRSRQALPELPGLPPRPVHRPLGRTPESSRADGTAGRTAQDHGRHHGGHSAGADVCRGDGMAWRRGQAGVESRHRVRGRRGVAPRHDRGPAVHRGAAADASHWPRLLRPPRLVGIALPLPRPLRRPGQDAADPLPLHRRRCGSGAGRDARLAGSRPQAGEVYHIPLAAGVALSPPPAGPSQRLAAAREALYHAALPQNAGVARPGPAGLFRQLPASHGPLPPRSAAGHATPTPSTNRSTTPASPCATTRRASTSWPRPAAAPAAV